LWELANEAAASELEVGDSFDLHRTTVKVTLELDRDVWAEWKDAAKRKKTSARTLAQEALARLVMGGPDGR
jgi:RNA:NAD 2'-phosphotransferase (TPT1/KptA family)